MYSIIIVGIFYDCLRSLARVKNFASGKELTEILTLTFRSIKQCE